MFRLFYKLKMNFQASLESLHVHLPLPPLTNPLYTRAYCSPFSVSAGHSLRMLILEWAKRQELFF